MSKLPEVFSNMLAAWNERDLTKIRAFLDRCLAETVVFADPTNFVCGRDAFEEMVKDFRRKYPEAFIRRTSGLDTHNNRYRYAWEIENDGQVFIKGTDFVELSADGLVVRVDGFFGPLPPLE